MASKKLTINFYNAGNRESSSALSGKMKGKTMLQWALIFLVVAIVAAVLGFGGIAGTASWIAQVIFVVFVILAIIAFIRRNV
ncbi:DUF1328 domain-containing protein [Tritonibacter mobilis]|uniref:DUF1328 domain-containing protein n=2 Tax=Tritonibacter mobilis TaxID=379347 RepID=UPI000899D5C6|nr:Uncharacterized membrane protein YtjA, UPF0391 family [Tritonibacter mobilis]